VGYEPGNIRGDRLLTLGFFREECSDTTQLFMSRQDQKNFIQSHENKRKQIADSESFGSFKSFESTLMFFFAMISIISTGIAICVCIKMHLQKSKPIDPILNNCDTTPSRSTEAQIAFNQHPVIP